MLQPCLSRYGLPALAAVWIDLDKDLAIVLMTNMGGELADAALKFLAQELYLRYAGPGR